ncbi:MAG TPA: hypothetical protein DCS93_01735 [Microscillaceae bacterium]|nr:hypothetical protein [Microscillaceae bacterium]
MTQYYHPLTPYTFSNSPKAFPKLFRASLPSFAQLSELPFKGNNIQLFLKQLAYPKTPLVGNYSSKHIIT